MVVTDHWRLPKSALESLTDTETSASSVGPAPAERELPDAHGADGHDRETELQTPTGSDETSTGAPAAVVSRVGVEEPYRLWEGADLPNPLRLSTAGGLKASASTPIDTRVTPEDLTTWALPESERPARTVPAVDVLSAPPAVQRREFGFASSYWTDQQEALKFRVHRRLIERLEPRQMEGLSLETVRAQVELAARAMLQTEAPEVIGVLRDQLATAIGDEVLGLGPIEPLLRDPSISEVMVNAPDAVYYERAGRLSRASVKFRDVAHVMRIVDRILAPLGRRVDEASPMADARLADGSRVNVIIPPASLKTPVITIRKFKADKMRMADLIRVGALTERAAMFLSACVNIRRNVIISGGTGSGKTTLLNALSGSIAEDERIVTIEDPAELRLQQPHVISLEGRPPSIDGAGEITTRQLVRNALRMRPERIIVGECRGSEAFDMLQAMNTGHDGSLSTVHANSPRDAISRIESMVLMTGLELPLTVVRQQIASAIHLVVQVARFRDGSRKVIEISQITGMEGNVISMQALFKFENEGMDERRMVLGKLRCQGLRPSFAPEFELEGISLPSDFFTRDADL